MRLENTGEICKALKRFAVTQADFAAEVGGSFVHVNRQLRGVAPITPEKLEIFAEAAVKLIQEQLTEGVLQLEQERRDIDESIRQLKEEGKAFWSDLVEDEEGALDKN